MVQAMSVKNDVTGATVTDTGAGGPPGSRDAQQTLSATGRIKAQLHGPRGDPNGALLEDGTIVRLPPPEAQRLASMLAAGAPLTVQGNGFESPLGRVIEARSIGPDATEEGARIVDAGPPEDDKARGGAQTGARSAHGYGGLLPHTAQGLAAMMVPKRRADGSDADRVGAWPERGIFDTQLGPNRNGRKW